MNNIWDIVILAVALILFILMVIFIRQADKQFRDKSLDLKEGMNVYSSNGDVYNSNIKNLPRYNSITNNTKYKNKFK